VLVPSDLRYSADHEWVAQEGELVRIGITDYAQDALGDVVFVSLPEPGDELEPAGAIGEVESTKSVSEVYAPVRGTVVEVNARLAAEPDLVNRDPYGAGWLCVIRPNGPLDGLMDADAYRALTES
jgi:glycine cleavage system H protein